MPNPTVAKLNVQFEGDTSKLDAATKKAERSVKKVAKDLEKPSLKFTEGLSKAFALMGAVEGATKLVGAAVKGIKGDFQGVEEILKTLPFGIGAVASAIADLRDELSGAADEMREMAKIGAELDRRDRAKQAKDATRKSVFGKTVSSVGSLKNQLELQGKEGAELQIAQLEQRRRSLLAQSQARGAEAFKLGSDGRGIKGKVQEERQLINKLIDAQVEGVKKAEAERLRLLELADQKQEVKKASRPEVSKPDRKISATAQEFDIARSNLAAGSARDKPVNQETGQKQLNALTTLIQILRLQRGGAVVV